MFLNARFIPEDHKPVILGETVLFTGQTSIKMFRVPICKYSGYPIKMVCWVQVQ